MESNKNNDNNGADEEHEQLQESARKRKLNELTNDGDKPRGEEDQPELAECSSSKKNRDRDEENDMDLELESLSREELIKLVQKQMGMTMEAQKQLEAAKKETDEKSATAKQRQQEEANRKREIASKMEEFKRALLASQQKVEELTGEMAKLNAEYQKLLEIVQLPYETKKEIADDKPMKIELSLETWYDWLEFVPRRQLGQIIPMIGDRNFALIAQEFLHKYGEIMIGDIEIVAPYEEHPNGPHPLVRAWQYRPLLRFEMAEAPMPENIKNYHLFVLSYFDEAMHDFMQEFQQNGLLDNVNLSFAKLPSSSKDLLPTVLCHILPLIKGIVSNEVQCSSQLVDIYDAENSKEIYERNMKMMEETRILHVVRLEENVVQPLLVTSFTDVMLAVR